MDIFLMTIFALLALLAGIILGSFITFYLLFKKRMRDENNQ
tara:strand:- start:48 stop:170 length:123 start_codon:yes stop_codon:yes gene_type:complete